MVTKCSNAEIFVVQKWKSEIMDKISVDVHDTVHLIVYTINQQLLHGGVFQEIQTVQRNTARSAKCCIWSNLDNWLPSSAHYHTLQLDAQRLDKTSPLYLDTLKFILKQPNLCLQRLTKESIIYLQVKWESKWNPNIDNILDSLISTPSIFCLCLWGVELRGLLNLDLS